ncbi:MAG: tetratricopeptide repeat protein [Bacteroidota bacterium]
MHKITFPYQSLFCLLAFTLVPTKATQQTKTLSAIQTGLATTSALCLASKTPAKKSTTTTRTQKGYTYTFYTDGIVAVTGPFGEDLGTHPTNNPYPKPHQAISLEKAGDQSAVFVGLGLQGGCYLCGTPDCTTPENCLHADETKAQDQEDKKNQSSQPSLNTNADNSLEEIQQKDKSLQPNENNDPDNFLEKLQKGLNKALPHIQRAKGKNCVILIGDTGVGKSTLINALYSGIKNMKEVEEEKSTAFGVIIHKYLVPEKEITDEQGNPLFSVGAGNQSVTSYPQIAQQGKIAFCDCPGFGDTRDAMFDIVNCSTMGELLMNAESVQLCYLMTEKSVTDTGGRGQHIKKLLQTAYTVFNKDDKQQGPITYDNLRKLRFVITQPSGNTKKIDLQSQICDILTQEITNIEHQKIIEHLLSNLFVIDAKDRPDKFLEGETQDTVADLKAKLVDIDNNIMLYSPKVFTYPITPQAKEKIETALKSMQERVMQISTSNDTLENQLKKIDKEILQPFESLNQYQLLRPLVKKPMTLVHEVKKSIEDKDKNEKLIRENTTLTAQASKHKKEIDKLQTGKQKLEKKIDELRTERNTLRKANRGLTQQKNNLRTANQGLTQEVGTLEADKQDLTEKLDTLEAEKNNLRTANQGLTQEVGTLEADKNSLKADKQDLTEKVDTLEAERNNLRTDKQGLTQQVGTLEADKNNLQTERNNLQIANQGLVQERNHLQIANQGLTQQVGTLQTERNNLQEEKEGLNQQIGPLEAEKEGLTGQVGDLYNQLGTVYENQGDHAQAIENFENALNLFISLGENRLDVATSYHDLGRVYYSQNKYQQAIQNFQNALNIRVEILGTNHPLTRNTRTSLGSAQSMLNSPIQALVVEVAEGGVENGAAGAAVNVGIEGVKWLFRW